ncbi:hypothetical protein AAG906_016052 [Vitis piasezkii]
MSWLQKGVKIDTVGSKELEEDCVVIIVTNSTTPKTNVGCYKENLPIGDLDRAMEGAFLKYATTQISLSKEQMDLLYRLLNQSQQPNNNIESCNLAQTGNFLAAFSLHSRKTIDNAKIHERLYLFRDEDSKNRQALVFGFESIFVSKDKIMLWHHRLAPVFLT